MNSSRSTLLTRTLTGAIFVLSIFASFLHIIAFSGLFYLFMLLCLFEFFNMLEKSGAKPQKSMSVLGATSIYIFGVIWPLFSKLGNENNILNIFGIYQSIIVFSIIVIPFVVLIVELFRNKTNIILNISTTVFSYLYIAIPFACIGWLSNFGNTNNFKLVIGFFVILWSSDTFAYLVGSMIGKHRLFERVSPKKSWEGSIGGLVFSLGAAWCMWYFLGEISLIAWLIMAIIIVVFGTLGDLIESAFKRSLDMKDSGNLLPGHGGFLDRFDSTLIAAPAIFIINYLTHFLTKI